MKITIMRLQRTQTRQEDEYGLACRGKTEEMSVQADVYSFGVVLWELVTGESPRFGQAWYRDPR